MKANRYFSLLILLLLPATGIKAVQLITGPAGPDKTERILQLLFAVAALITLYFLNFYRKKRK